MVRARGAQAKRFSGDKEYALMKFVVGEVQQTKRRYLKLLDHQDWMWTLSVKEATRFSNHQAAEDAIQVIFEENDFDLNIFTVLKTGREYTLYSTSRNDNLRNIIEIDNKDLREKDVEQILWDKEEINFEMMSSDFIIKNQQELRSLTIIKIGQLIDFHNKCKKQFSTAQLAKEEGGFCGCRICRKIQYFVDFLDRPEMSKKVFYEDEIHEAFKDFLAIKGLKLQRITEEQIPILAECFANYRTWKSVEYSNKEIAKIAGVSLPSFASWIKELKVNGYGYLLQEEEI